jgi:hypothetical protein
MTVAQSRIGVRLVVVAAHASAHDDIESDESIAVGDGDEPEILGKHVDVVHGRHGEPDLELAGQVG